MEYRTLGADTITMELFDGFQRRQVVTRRWQKENGRWIIVDDSFVDDWTKADYETLVASLIDICRYGGAVFGAFADRRLKGFAAVKATPFGQRREYLDLEYIHVSQDMRGQGIGRVLFDKAKCWAKEHGAEKLYISAHSSVESQAFYRAAGCVEAAEYNAEHVRREPYDCQLECEL